MFGDPVVAPASTGCSITAMSSPSAATATACARSAVPVFSTQPTLTWRRLITHDSRQICAPACRHPGAHRYLPRSAPPAAWRRSATRGSLLWTPAPSHTPSTKGGRFYRGVTSGCRLIRMGRARSRDSSTAIAGKSRLGRIIIVGLTPHGDGGIRFAHERSRC